MRVTLMIIWLEVCSKGGNGDSTFGNISSNKFLDFWNLAYEIYR